MRRRRVLLGAVAAVLLALLAGWLLRPRVLPEEVAVRPQVTLRAVNAGASPAVVPLPTMPAAEALAAVPASAPADRPVPIELCGVGTVPGTSTQALDRLPPGHGQQAWDVLLPRVLATLEAGGVRQRVAARLLLAVDAPPPQRERLADEALALVQSAPDGPAAAWVVGLCGHSVRHCLPAAARAWTEAEPGNAAAWVALADATETSRADAVATASRAAGHRSHWGVLAATALEAVPDDTQPYLRMMVVGKAIVADSLFMPMPAGVLQHCRESPGPACETLARLMAGHADNLIGQSLGESIGRTQGWPEDELAALKARRSALMSAAVLPGADQPLGCTAAQALLDAVPRMARDGELPYLRQRLAAGR